MKKIYYLSTCDTCRRIMREIVVDESWEKREIKSEPIPEEELAKLRDMTDNYDALFSRRSRQYRSRGLHEKELSEKDIKDLILSEYTFLKRPVILINGRIYIGNSKQVVEDVKKALASQ